MSIYRLKISVNKEWLLWSHLMLYASTVTKVLFPSGCAYVDIGQSSMLSKPSGVCKRQYQGRGPENCKNT